jgi:hypothetical protein
VAIQPELLDWWALELAFGHVAPGHHAFLDRELGEVVTIQEELPGARAVIQRIHDGGERFVKIEPVASRDQHRWMVRFIPSVEDLPLRERLAAAVAQPGAFRCFKEVLQTAPEERERWFAHRKQLLRVHIERWLADNDLAGVMIEDPRATPALRQRAHELIDRMPAADLPNAVAYLMHLGVRGDVVKR